MPLRKGAGKELLARLKWEETGLCVFRGNGLQGPFKVKGRIPFGVRGNL